VATIDAYKKWIVIVIDDLACPWSFVSYHTWELKVIVVMIIIILLSSRLGGSTCHDDCIERLRTSCLSMLKTFGSIEYRSINRFVASTTYR